MDSTNALFYKLQAIAAVSGKKDKLAIVQTFTPFEQSIVKMALDPTQMFYIAKLEPSERFGTDEWEPAEFDLLEDLSQRTVTGSEALAQVQFHMCELSKESGELLRRVITKDLKAGIGVGTVNTAFPGLIPDFAYMRCSLPKDSNFDKLKWEDGVFAQLKADGMFARVDNDGETVLITSRQGNTFPEAALAPLATEASRVFAVGTQTHGELTVWIDGKLQPRSAGNGMLNSLQLGGELPEGAEVRFDAWDQVPLHLAVPKGRYEEAYEYRLASLEDQILSGKSELIHLIEHRVVHSKVEALTYYREVLARKLEGIIVKNPRMPWLDGDSKDQIKFKLEVDVDLKIVGFRPGEVGKRTEHTFGSVLCRTLDDKLEVAVSGFKRDMEQYLHENRDSVLHKVMCVRANSVAEPGDSNPLYSLYHPRFVELRNDKYEPDTLEQVIAQFEAATS